MGCADCCGKTFLVILNTFIIILGVVSLGAGLFLRFGQSITSSMLGPLLDSLMSAASTATTSTSSPLSTAANGVSSVTSIFEVAAGVLIGLGAFMLIVGVFGCCGACCKVKCMLAVYAAVVLLVFIAKIVILGLWLGKTVDDKMFASMVKDVKTKYAGPTSFEKESLLLNVIMIELKCCGIESYTEFAETVKWNRTFVYTSGSNSMTVDQVIPVSCCKVNGTFPTVTPVDTNCTITPTYANSNINTTCHEAIQDQIDAHKAAVFGAYAGVLAFELGCSLVAICLLVRMDKQKKNKVHPEGDHAKSHAPAKKNQVEPKY